MDITGASNYNVSNYTISKDLKSLESKNTKNDNSVLQTTTQSLGTDTFVKSTEQDTDNLTYKPEKKKLSSEEIQTLKDQQESLKSDLITKFINDTINNQNTLLGKSTGNNNNDSMKTSTDLLTKIFGSVENAYPPIVTDPEGAKKAISEGGAYSVDSVADRIMTMATALAGGDPNKLQQMREAVDEGFKQAGLDFNKVTNSDLPQICKDTYSEVMNRFDKLQNNTSITNL